MSISRTRLPDASVLVGMRLDHRPVRAMVGPPAGRVAWCALACRMGYGRQGSQRAEILAARAAMIWSSLDGHDDPSVLLVSTTLRAMLGAICDQHRQQLLRVGVAQLGDARRLIGVEGRDGFRYYLLDAGIEAIHVLTEAPPPGLNRHDDASLR